MQSASGVPSAPSMKKIFRLHKSAFCTIQVLQKTKSTFRSQDSVGLRKYLVVVLQETTETLKNTEASTDNPL